MAATLIVAGFFLAPKIDEALAALRHLRSMQPAWMVLALAAEAASLLAFSAVTYLLIERSCRPIFRRVLRADLVTIALSHAVPVGSAAGTALGYELLEHEGVGSLQAGFSKVTQSLVSGILLQVMLWGALALSLLFQRPTAEYLGLTAAGGFMVATVVIFAWLLARREPVIRRLAIRLLSWVPRLDADRIGRFVDGLCERLHRLSHHPGTLTWVCLWSLGNWVFDEVALWASLRAFGGHPGLVELTVAFSVAQVAASLPISPGGLGVVESSLIPLLTGLGTDASVAVLGVLVWRLFNYWLPLPVGGAAYLLILADRRRNGGAVRPAFRYPAAERDCVDFESSPRGDLRWAAPVAEDDQQALRPQHHAEPRVRERDRSRD